MGVACQGLNSTMMNKDPGRFRPPLGVVTLQKLPRDLWRTSAPTATLTGVQANALAGNRLVIRNRQ